MSKVATDDRWAFTGDVNLQYGGSFFDLSDWEHGYCYGVLVTDLDSGCGFRGAVMVEHVIVSGTDDPERIGKAITCCGWLPADLSTVPEDRRRQMIADALCSYGYRDVESCEILQLEPDGPMRFEGWKVDKRLHNTTLEDYVRSQHLNR